MTLIDFLRDQSRSQFVGGGLMLMFTGSLIALIRKVPMQAWNWCRGRITRSISIENTDPLFDYVTYWLNSQERFRKSRFLKATTELRLRQSDDSEGPCASFGSEGKKKKSLQVFFSPSSGRHLFLYKQTWVSIARSSQSAQSPGSGQAENSSRGGSRKEESYCVESYGRGNGEVLKGLIQEVVEFGTEETEGIRIYFNNWGHWSSNGYTRMRPLSTVDLPTGVASSILEDMREFRSQEARYRDLGIPWHKGYLFYGLPGTGKTSLAAALAGELDMDVYLMNLSGTGMNDENLQRLMSDVRSGCMVILEDIDCTVPDRDAGQVGNRVTLSGLLNCLDGIMSRDGCVIAMTTNRRESLDDALLRPGRVDYELKFGLAEFSQIEALANRIGVGCAGMRGGVMTMAEAQKELLARYRDGKGISVAA